MNRKLRILVAPSNKGGCSQHRLYLPFQKIEELYSDEVELKFNENPLGLDTSSQTFKYFDPEQRPYRGEIPDIDWADIVVTNNIHNFGISYTAAILMESKLRGKLAHWDTDDLLINIYEGHRLKKTYVDNNLEQGAKELYAVADLVTVTQQKFAEKIAPYAFQNNGQIAIIKNCLDLNHETWKMPKVPNPKNICRFGWVGGIHHDVDVKQIFGIFSAVNQKVGAEKVFWGMYGKPSIPKEDADNQWQMDVWRGYEKYLAGTIRGRRKNYQIYGAMPTTHYGQFYTNIDCSIAPLEPNEFNDSKSHIKAVEAGAYKMPLIATNVGDYDSIIIPNETGILISPENSKSEWIRQLTRVAKDKKFREEMGKNLHEVVSREFDLNKVVYKRIELYKQLLDWDNKKDEQ